MSLRYVILTVLAEGPATGYDIAKSFDESLRFFWMATHQQIYRDLKGLAADGWVTTAHVAQSHRPNKKVYSLSGEGRSELERWVMTAVEPRVNSELLVKLMATATFGSAAVDRLLLEQRRIHEARLSTYRGIERRVTELNLRDPRSLRDTLRFMTLRRGIRGEEDWIGWIDEVLARR